MPAKLIQNQKDIEAETTDRYTIWPLFASSTLGRQIDAVSGIVAYKQQELPVDDGDGHEFAEFYYVIEGTGTVQFKGEAQTIQGGDSFVIPPDTPHAIWSDEAEPLVAFYVAIVDE